MPDTPASASPASSSSPSGASPVAPQDEPLGGRWAATRRQMQRVWSLSLPYFSSEEKWQARGLLVAIVALNLATVYLNVLFNDWNKLFYDALQEKQAEVFWTQLGRFCYLAFGYIVIVVYQFYLTQLLQIRWRTWMSTHYLQRWLSDQAFYRFELARYSTQPGASPSESGNANRADTPDNPDQRIQEDVHLFTTQTLSLSMGLLNALVTLGSFIGILWALSGGFSFTVAGMAIVIPGFMVWMAVVYSLAGTLITHWVGRPQIALNFRQQQYEADFRHRMVRVREYSESIALDRGEPAEQQQLGQRLGRVVSNYLALIGAQKRLIWFTSFFGQAAVVFPFVVAAPRFFSGAIQLGELMQISSAFGQVQGALSWFVDSYPKLAVWRATTDRLTSFEVAFRTVQTPRVTVSASTDGSLRAQHLQVGLPNGNTLLAPTNFQLPAGDSVWLSGPSGSGKSSLFRALAGIWPFASGAVQRVPDSQFLPQRPYLPDGPLRDALAYPEPADTYPDTALQQALRDALLEPLTGQLDRVEAWSQKLSGGEQQRLAIARVFLKQPRWVFADEATSALDPRAEATLYQRLRDTVLARQGGLVSIAHRAEVAAFHHRHWVFEAQAPGGDAAFTLSEKSR